MGIYNLEENPDMFITPDIWDNEFVYRVERFDAMDNKTTVNKIDLRSDKLMIYGVEIKESMLKRLYESLVLKSRAGITYVNCNGACYFHLTGKVYRLVHNVIYDWSQFGIIVPNTINESLNKQLKMKEEEVDRMNKLLSRVEAEALSSKTSLEASNNEVKELKEQLLLCQKEKRDMKVQMQKVSDRLPLIEFELEITKIELESYKKESKDLQDELFSCIEESKNMEVELQRVRDQVSSINLEAIEIELKKSKKRERDYDEQLLNSKKERQSMEEEVQAMQHQLSLAKHELEFTKRQLDSLEKRMSEHILLIDSNVQSTNKKLDQLLTSTLWNELNRCHLPQDIGLRGTRYEDYLLPLKESNSSFCDLPVIHDPSNSMDKSSDIFLTIKENVHEELSNDKRKDRTQDECPCSSG